MRIESPNNATDNATIAEMKAAEGFETGVIKKVNLNDAAITFYLEDGEVFGVAARRCPGEELPAWLVEAALRDELKGKPVRVYPGGLGSRVEGVDVDGREVFWATPLEREASFARQAAAIDRERRERFAQQREELDRDFDSLPPEFQARIARRRRNRRDFRVMYERYEMFCCKQAVAFARHALGAVGAPDVWERDEEGRLCGEYGAQAVEWLEGWALLNSDEAPENQAEDWRGWEPLRQRTKDFDHAKMCELMPAYAGSEHSGNTFGAALQLAVRWLLRPEDVDGLHGALAPLVGSEDYGDIDPVAA